MPRTRPDPAPVGLVGVVGREQQQDLRLQRIGVLELVDEDALEARLEAARGRCALSRTRSRAPSSRSRKSSAPARAFSCVVAVDGAAQVALQQRREVGVGVHAGTDPGAP